MTRRLLRRIPFVSVATLDSAAAAAAEWWDVTGTTADCVAAYAAKGAASLAASYLDLTANANDITPGVAPTWDATNGWTFNGSTQYLDTGVTPAADSWSYIVRYTDATVNAGALFGFLDSSKRTYILPNQGASGVGYSNGSAAVSKTPSLTSGVLCVTGDDGYRDGVSDTADPGTWGAGTALAIYIGAMKRSASTTNFTDAKIQALAIYNVTLTAPQVATLTTNMNAL